MMWRRRRGALPASLSAPRRCVLRPHSSVWGLVSSFFHFCPPPTLNPVVPPHTCHTPSQSHSGKSSGVCRKIPVRISSSYSSICPWHYRQTAQCISGTKGTSDAQLGTPHEAHAKHTARELTQVIIEALISRFCSLSLSLFLPPAEKSMLYREM